MAGFDSLMIENLSRSIQVDGPGGGAVSDARVERVMRDNGMSSPGGGAGAAGGAEGGGRTFGQMLEKSLEQVNEHQVQADHAVKELVAGKSKNIHETMLAIERADMSLKLAMQVRNKILDAYREVMRMQV